MLAVVGGAISLANLVHREVLGIVKHQPEPNCKTSRKLTNPHPKALLKMISFSKVGEVKG